MLQEELGGKSSKDPLWEKKKFHPESENHVKYYI